MKKISKKYFVIIIALILLFVIGTVMGKIGTEKMSAVLLYDGTAEVQQYFDTYSQLQHSFIANLDVEKADVSKSLPNLDKYDLVYLDSSVSNKAELKNDLISYVENGGNMFVPNEFSEYFDLNFFGAKEIVKVDSVPTGMTYGDVSKDAAGIQEIIEDFSKLYGKYEDYEYLSQLDYGYGFIPESSVSLADYNGISLYGLNKYGEGTVFYTNKLLPDSYHINGFEMEKRTDVQTHFSNSSATANQLILSEFASYISKMKYGYSIKKVLGSFGNPAMAWQLHFEEISALENNAAIKFAEICKEYNTIPSYSLVRNAYKGSSRYESVTYLLNKKDSYHVNLQENAYSSGAHVVEGDKYLALAEVANAGNYFADSYDFMQMAYPDVNDFNEDGIADIVSGSSDGRFYYFVGDGYGKEWKVKERQVLSDEEGNPLSVGGYSSPCMLDYDGDGVMDIISGSENGNIYLFKGLDETHFHEGKMLFAVPGLRRTMPYVADVTDDGIVDFVVGSVDGIMNIYTLSNDGGYALTRSIQCENETFVAPGTFDYDDDGAIDLIYGTFDGYIRKLKNVGNGEFADDGFFDTDEMNYKGNNHIKFGNNCVPRFFDIDRDGFEDMIAGELEYGLAIPIDSPYFKQRDVLQEQVDYMKKNNYYLGVHFYTKEYSSAEREAEELRLHKRAFDSYGIDYDDVGVNLHTWRMSEASKNQTLKTVKDGGMKWISCFRTTDSATTQNVSAENSLISPFFMDFESKDFMVTNASALGGNYDEFAYMSAKYDLPISEYYHCDFVYRDEQAGRSMIENVVSYQNEHEYNFVREDQLIKASAAAYNAGLVVKNRSGRISLKAEAIDRRFPLYDKDYQDCVGVKVEFAEGVDTSKVGIDADVWRYDANKNALYVGLDSDVDIRLDGTENKKIMMINSAASHILRVNVPAEVRVSGKKATVKFEDDGMMQVVAAGKVANCTEGWDVDYTDGISTITKFGSESDLYFEFEE